MSESIHQEIDFKADPKRIYDVLTSAKQFSEMSGGAPTEIDPTNGGFFSCFGGMILGRNIELEPNQRIVQAWRVKTWEPGLYSIIKFGFKSQNAGTRMIFDHVGFPDDQRDHLAKGWHENYWDTLKKYLE